MNLKCSLLDIKCINRKRETTAPPGLAARPARSLTLAIYFEQININLNVKHVQEYFRFQTYLPPARRSGRGDASARAEAAGASVDAFDVIELEAWAAALALEALPPGPLLKFASDFTLMSESSSYSAGWVRWWVARQS